MNTQNFQSFNTTPSQTQVYPDGTVRIVQNTNPVITTATMVQTSQEQHPHQHPQIIQNKVQSQTVYYTQGQGQQGQGQQAVIMKSAIGANGLTTPPMSYDSTIYSTQGQNQGQGQAIPLYSASSMNIQPTNTPPSSNEGTNTVMVTQQGNVINDINTSYTVAQSIQSQAQEANNYSNQIFVLPSPSTPTPQINFTASANSQSNIIQVQQTSPQSTPHSTTTNSSQYVITQKPGQAMGVTSQQVIIQAPPTPYGTSPTTQVQVLTQNVQTSDVINSNMVATNIGNATIVSPTQVQYQYSVTPPLTDKEVQIKPEGKVSPEMSINDEKIEGQDKNGTSNNDSQTVLSSNFISNPGRLFNKISISSPTTTSMYTVDSSVSVDPTSDKDHPMDTKEDLSPAGEVKDKLECKNSNSQANGNLKEESSQGKDNKMNIDVYDSKMKMEPTNDITVMTTIANNSIATTLDPSAMMTQTITSPQGMTATSNGLMQTSTMNNNNGQSVNIVSGVNTIQGVNVGINPVNKINIINGVNGMNNVNYVPTNMNFQTATATNVNINGMNPIQGVQVATALPQQMINTMNNMNVMNGNTGNIISISSGQSPIPINSNNSINLYYNQGQNIINGTQNTNINYPNPNIMKTSVAKGLNGYRARTKNSHIVDPTVPVEVLIKRQKNTEAARRSRLRKAEKIQELTEMVRNLEETNKEYSIKIAELQSEKANWNKKEAEHQSEKANWNKKEAEYIATIKQLREKLKELNSNEAENDENDENSINIEAPTSNTIDTESPTATSEASTSTITVKNKKK